MEERLTRYELGEIKQTHDRAHYINIDTNDLAHKLKRIGLSPNASRSEVVERVRQIEKDMEERGI